MSREAAAALALLLASGVARAEVEAEPSAGPSPEHVTSSADAGRNASRRDGSPVGILGFGVIFGGNAQLAGAKGGLGLGTGGGPVPAEFWMASVEYDTTESFFHPRRAPAAGGIDRISWVHAHLEYGRQLAHPRPLFGWVMAGSTLGTYTAGETDAWFPGVVVGAGIQWEFVRVGVRYYGQWRRATVPAAAPGASRPLHLEPMLFVTAGVELWRLSEPSPRGQSSPTRR